MNAVVGRRALVLDRGDYRLRPARRRRARAARVVLLVLLVGGCGESAPPPAQPRLPFPPTAQEPAKAPPPKTTPTGTVVKVGTKPEGVAIDPQTGVAAVAIAEGVALVDAATGARKALVTLPAP